MKNLNVLLNCDIENARAHVEEFAKSLKQHPYESDIFTDGNMGSVQYELIPESNNSKSWLIIEKPKRRPVGKVELSQVIPENAVRLVIFRTLNYSLNLGTNYPMNDYIKAFYTCFYSRGLIRNNNYGQGDKPSTTNQTNAAATPQPTGINIDNINSDGTQNPTTTSKGLRMNWLNGIVAILKPDGVPMGTGFVVSKKGYIATSTHLLRRAETDTSKHTTIRIRFKATQTETTAYIDPQWCSPVNENDVTVLFLTDQLPDEVEPLPLVSGQDTLDHKIRSWGYPDGNDTDGWAARGEILGETSENDYRRLQFSSKEITRGFSGGPLWDDQLQGVIGVVKRGSGGISKPQEAGLAVPSEALITLTKGELTGQSQPPPTEPLPPAAATPQSGGINFGPINSAGNVNINFSNVAGGNQTTTTTATTSTQQTSPAAANPSNIPPSTMTPAQFNELLRQQFNESELKDICLALNIDYESLAGNSKADKTRELILYLQRRGRVPHLLILVKQERPHTPWPDTIQ